MKLLALVITFTKEATSVGTKFPEDYLTPEALFPHASHFPGYNEARAYILLFTQSLLFLCRLMLHGREPMRLEINERRSWESMPETCSLCKLESAEVSTLRQ